LCNRGTVDETDALGSQTTLFVSDGVATGLYGANPSGAPAGRIDGGPADLAVHLL
jgi:hypothetical protein